MSANTVYIVDANLSTAAILPGYQTCNNYKIIKAHIEIWLSSLIYLTYVNERVTN